MPLTEGGAFWRGPGAVVCRGAIPRSPLSPPLTRGLFGACFMPGANRGPAAAQTFAGGMNPAPTNKFYVLGRPGWPRPCVRTNPCRGRCLHRPANLAALQTRVGADAISARFAAVRAVLASLVKGRWPSEAGTEGLLRREMPLAEGGARFGGAPGGGSLPGGNPRLCRLPGAAFGGGAIPQSAGFARSQPPLTRGPVRGVF